ncbi:MAG: ABC transporter ATP-binding protein [Candidatus Woesearchaeota archaeon]
METILELKDLVLERNNKKILNGLSMEIWKGHIHAIVGPNGAGKSTLSYALMGLEEYRDVKGKIIFKGKSISDLDVTQRAKKGITLAWQEPARFEGLSVRQYLKASCKCSDEKVIEEALDLMGLEPCIYLDRALDKTLSGGERKRIELASIYVMEPELVIMDEPDSGIDIEAIERIFSMIESLKDKGTTVIFITHSTAVLEKSDHAFLLCDGKILDKGTKDHIQRYFEKKCISCKHPNAPSKDVVEKLGVRGVKNG